MSNSFFYPGRRRRPTPPPPSPPRGPRLLIPPPEYSTPKYLKNYNEWVVYLDKNPRVYQLICEYADEAMRAGHTFYAIATIWELIRWDHTVRTEDINFKMPHNHRAFYSRMWMLNNPAFAGFFRTAIQRSGGHNGPMDEYGRDI